VKREGNFYHERHEPTRTKKEYQGTKEKTSHGGTGARGKKRTRKKEKSKEIPLFSFLSSLFSSLCLRDSVRDFLILRVPVRGILVTVFLFAVSCLFSCFRAQAEVPVNAVAAGDAVADAVTTVIEEPGSEDTLIIEASWEVSVSADVETGVEPAPEDHYNAPLSESRFAVIPPSARPGEPVTVAFSGGTDPGFNVPNARFQAVLLDSRGRRLTNARFFSLQGEGEIWAAILAVPSTALIGNATIRIDAIATSGGTEIITMLPLTIERREFPSETIALNQENTDLRTVEDPQKTAEAEEIWAIYLRTGTEVYSGGPFIPPVTSTRRTSAYGSRRVYRYADNTTDTTIHAGVDIGVPTGTEVRSSAAGRVVLAKYRIVTGNTVVLEHLPGVYSLYYHMDSIAVSPGDIVEAGALLGKSGFTGLATGPHLHWEIRVSGENADPDAFLSRPVLDKNDIFDKLSKPF